MLNPDDHIDLYILHYVFLPIIQQQLDVFRAAWACHALRTREIEPLINCGFLGCTKQICKIKVRKQFLELMS